MDNKLLQDNLIESTKYINVIGSRVHNLKNIDVRIPRNKLTVITGLSGSGKSSLAFDTLYAEGQRRYIETFSAYARQFLGSLERPDVDRITGLSPVISIDQKTTNKNPRSTVGTITEIYDYLRLLYARASEAFSYQTGEKMIKYTDNKIIELIFQNFINKKIIILAPVIRGRKGHYKELFENIRKKGFLYARIDGEIKDLVYGLKVDRYKIHDIEIVIDKTIACQKDEKRLKESIQIAMKHGKGITMILDIDKNEIKYYSRNLMCPSTGESFEEPAPHTFSFNSPHGACPHCGGLGYIKEIDINKIIPDQSISIARGGILPLGKYRSSLIFWQLEAIAAKYKFALSTPIKEIPESALNVILYGSGETFRLKSTSLGSSNYLLSFDGIINYILENHTEKQLTKEQKWYNQFISNSTCPECSGSRLKKESLQFKINNKNISDLSKMDISDLYSWLDEAENNMLPKQKQIAKEILKEIKTRLKFLINVGVDYLSLDRNANSLSGGESQRIRLATQIGSQLVNVLYILDEPSIGLHQKDNKRLIKSLHELKDLGNTVIVVEHDKEMILSADYIIDIGPFAGKLGGNIIAIGTPEEILKANTLTACYLNNTKEIKIPLIRRKGNGKFIKISGACGNNLKNISVSIPLGKFICVTGVSGSGKSSLINETLHPVLSRYFYNSYSTPLPYKSIEGIENIDKVIEVNQAPIGKTPRSNPATYTNLFTEIRKLFENLPESKIRGYKAGRFSFNIKGGRCETCGGAGLKVIEMNFLPDVYVKCEECNGKRYNMETLEIRFKGKSINDVLEMTINQAVEFFENIPAIMLKLRALQAVGLGYVTIGQSSTTLSGGEAQRVKLATELAKKDTGKTLYILDEPTTGLHFEDINILLGVLNKLVDKGNTVIIIEHNLDVIKVADYIIDMGKDGGKNGGEIICIGTPEEIINNKSSYTAEYLRKELYQTRKILT